MAGYRKFIVALVVAALLAALVALQSALQDGQVTAYEWAGIGVALVGAIAVYAVPNEKDLPPTYADAGDLGDLGDA